MLSRIVSLRDISRREKKVNSLLEQEIAKILQREISFSNNVLVTLNRVEATANLIEAKVFISVFPEQKSYEVFKILKKEVFRIQQKINKKLKMRPIPKIIFAEDKKTSQAGRVEELLSQLKNNEK